MAIKIQVGPKNEKNEKRKENLYEEEFPFCGKAWHYCAPALIHSDRARSPCSFLVQESNENCSQLRSQTSNLDLIYTNKSGSK